MKPYSFSTISIAIHNGDHLCVDIYKPESKGWSYDQLFVVKPDEATKYKGPEMTEKLDAFLSRRAELARQKIKEITPEIFDELRRSESGPALQKFLVESGLYKKMGGRRRKAISRKAISRKAISRKTMRRKAISRKARTYSRKH